MSKILIFARKAPQFLAFVRYEDGTMMERWTDGDFEMSDRSLRGGVPKPVRPSKTPQKDAAMKYLEKAEGGAG